MTTLTLAALLCLAAAPPDGYVEVAYPPSTQPGELQFGVTYTLWLPPGVAVIRGVIVHQHGCGSGACKGGATAAYDLHWQALAKKWDCALLGPSYQQDDKQECRLWCDPRNGSEKKFLQALDDLAAKSGHKEIATVPWCLWGHSGGGTWSSLMQVLHPDRIVAVWLRSGTAFSQIEKDGLITPEKAAAVYAIPVMCNPGAKENGDKRFNGAWTGTMAMFKAYRERGAPIGFAPDPRTSHECGDSRCLAIPFFDACLSVRLSSPGGTVLKPLEAGSPWLAVPLSDTASPAAAFPGNPKESVWLPDERVAKAWMEYVKTGATSDSTPPPAPFGVKAAAVDGTVEITWSADADFESGLRAFVVQRDGKDLAQVPEKPAGRFGRPLFQSMSYHDTPEPGFPAMKFIDRTAGAKKHEYRVVAINGAELRSEPSKPASP